MRASSKPAQRRDLPDSMLSAYAEQMAPFVAFADAGAMEQARSFGRKAGKAMAQRDQARATAEREHYRQWAGMEVQHSGASMADLEKAYSEGYREESRPAGGFADREKMQPVPDSSMS